MNKEEILEKSRAENKNKDIYEQEILKQANSSAVIVMHKKTRQINLYIFSQRKTKENLLR